MYDALLIIDVQTALMKEHPCNEVEFIQTIKELIGSFRANHKPILYVQHDGGIGDELESGSEGWSIYHEIAPLSSDVLVEKKFNSAFRQTTLKEELDKIGAKSILMCGMQTEYCMDVSVKVAFEHGYHVTMVKNSTTTFDNEFSKGEKLTQYFEDKIWNNRYAKVISLEAFEDNMIPIIGDEEVLNENCSLK